VKRCTTCNRSFDDDTLSFCLEDGTPLVREPASRAESQETLVSPSPPAAPPASSALPPTQIYGQPPGTIGASQAAPGYAPATHQRRTWPWVVGILAIVFVIGGIVIAAVFIPPLLREAGNDNKPRPTPTRSDWTTTPTPVASPSGEADDVPDDEDEVLSQLTRVEEDWTRANVKGDKEALETILADEYVGGATAHSKREYIDSLTPDPSIKSWELKDLTVEQDGERATVKGTLTEETTKGTEVSAFTDKFIWRDQRWQAVASKATRVN